MVNEIARKAMIISASRRTDIPAFYSDWFMNRIRAGFFHRVNPFNANQVSAFSLKPEHVDAICFWTKNPRPTCRCVESVDMGIYNTCQFGCTYCYANFSDGMIENNRSKHDSTSPSLLGRHDGELEIQSGLKKKKCGGCQGELF